jgi:hypothetical protein
MFGSNRRNSFDDVFSFQREMDRVFNQFWNELPTRTAAPPSPSPSSSLQVTATDRLAASRSRPRRRTTSS